MMVAWIRDVEVEGKEVVSGMRCILMVYPIEFSDRLDMDCEINRISP